MTKRALQFTTFAFLVLFSTLFFLPNRGFAQTKNDVAVVLPFENKSGLPQYNWVGESFADSLSELLKIPGLNVVTNEKRKQTQASLNLPLTSIPSLATSIKISNAAGANLLVIGRYSITPAAGELAAGLRVTARVIRVQDGMIFGEQNADGRMVMREIDLADALANLQKLQAQIAFNVLYQRDNALPFSQNDFIQNSQKIPAQAFEAFIKGMLTPENSLATEGDPLRPRFFKKAIELYAKERNGETYIQAALELGHFYLKRKELNSAIEYFSRIPKGAPYYAEAVFYVGILQYQLGNAEGALETLRAVADEFRLTPIYNNLGAISVDIARKDKTGVKTERLTEAIGFLNQATTTSATDATALFNLGYALFLSGKYSEAAEKLRPILAANQRDGFSYFLLAKAMEKLNDTTAATSFDENARRYLPNYAKLQLEWQKSQTTSEIPVRLREVFNRNDNYLAANEAKIAANAEPEDLLKKSRSLYLAGRDDEALAELRRVQTADPMSAEAYYLIGSIQLRRGELEAAVSNLKTAVFWKTDLVEAYISLTKIFLEKNDLNQARTYIKIAIQLAPNNQEVISLYRRVEMGGK